MAAREIDPPCLHGVGLASESGVAEKLARVEGATTIIRVRDIRSGMPKTQPAEMTLTFPIFTVGTNTMKTVDLSQCVSIVNRRFYRQGLEWAVAGFSLHATSGSGSVSISKLPSTWVVSGAWEKMMRHWLKQQNEAVEEGGLQSAVARYRDFKIYMDKTHVDDGFGDNYLPYSRDNGGTGWTQYLPGEWNNSLIVIPNESGVSGNTQEFSVHMIGDNDPAPSQSKGIIKAYMDSRGVPQSPDPATQPNPIPETNIFAQMFDDGQNKEEILDNAIDRNDNLPYDQLEYPGGAGNANGLIFHDQMTISTTTVSGRTSAAGGTFPCGLIRFRVDPGLAAQQGEPVAWINVHLVPGNHRGYLAEPMTEM